MPCRMPPPATKRDALRPSGAAGDACPVGGRGADHARIGGPEVFSMDSVNFVNFVNFGGEAAAARLPRRGCCDVLPRTV